MVTADSALHELAKMAGAMTLGDPPCQYLFTLEQLAYLVSVVGPCMADLIALHDRLQEDGKNPVLLV